MYSLQKCPEYKFDQVKLGNTVHHYDKYRREMCAAAVIISRSWVDAQLHMQCITNAISLTLCPSEIWFANNLRNMVCLEKRNAVAKHEILHLLLLLLSSRAAAARWRGGEGCSLPATHKIGRSTILNISGNSWDLFINVLSVFWRSVMQSCQ